MSSQDYQNLKDSAEQLAWLSSACRFTNNGPYYSYSDFHYDPLIRKREFEFIITNQIFTIDDDDGEVCWHSLVGDTVIAGGFPIASRNADAKGLQISLDVMAALAGVSLAVDFGRGFMLKGEDVALIPVMRQDNYVQWHLSDLEPGSPSFPESDQPAHQGIKLEAEDLRSTTAFLGWTLLVSNFAGKCPRSIFGVMILYVEVSNM